MSEPARHLRVIDSNAEATEFLDHPEVVRLRDEIKGLTRALRKECREHEELKRDREAEARANQLWPKAMACHEAWKVACNHPRTGWDGPKFWMVEPLLKKYGLDVCLRAIAGIAYDHNSKVRRNGYLERYDGWDLVFRDSPHLERYANRAPKGWRELPHFAEALERWSNA